MIRRIDADTLRPFNHELGKLAQQGNLFVGGNFIANRMWLRDV
jgi:hypothetical protein